MDVYSRLRDVYDVANRNNTAVYSLDPRGLAPFEYGFDDIPFGPPPSFATDRRALQMTQDTLRVLSEETDGRAIVNRNTLAQGLADMMRDSSYLLPARLHLEADRRRRQVPPDHREGETQWRGRPRSQGLLGVDAGRRGEDQQARRPMSPSRCRLRWHRSRTSVQSGKYVRTWIGTERGENGKTRVTLIWEPLPAQGARRAS